MISPSSFTSGTCRPECHTTFPARSTRRRSIGTTLPESAVLILGSMSTHTFFADDVPHAPVHHFLERLAEPKFLGPVYVSIRVAGIDVGDRHGNLVHDQPQAPLGALRGLDGLAVFGRVHCDYLAAGDRTVLAAIGQDRGPQAHPAGVQAYKVPSNTAGVPAKARAKGSPAPNQFNGPSACSTSAPTNVVRSLSNQRAPVSLTN